MRKNETKTRKGLLSQQRLTREANQRLFGPLTFEQSEEQRKAKLPRLTAYELSALTGRW